MRFCFEVHIYSVYLFRRLSDQTRTRRNPRHTLETAVISHMACWGYARRTLATMVMRTLKTSLLEWHTLEMSCEKAVRNWYGARLSQFSITTALILPSSCRICRSERPAGGCTVTQSQNPARILGKLI